MPARERVGETPAAEHRTVARVMAILEVVVGSDSAGARLNDLSGTIQAPKSSVHGLAKGLVAEGYLREADGRYFLGPAVSALLASAAPNVPGAYRSTLERLSQEWGETTMLGSLVGDTLVYLDAVEPTEFIRAVPQLNRRLSLWPRSAGKCLLAFQDEKRREGYLRRQHTEEERPAIRMEIEQVHESKVGVNIGQSGSPHIAIASPIFSAEGLVTTTISIAGPASRISDRMDEISASVLAAAQALSYSN